MTSGLRFFLLLSVLCAPVRGFADPGCPDGTVPTLESFKTAGTSAHQFSALTACGTVISDVQEDVKNGVGNWDLKAYINEIRVCSCGVKSGAASTWESAKALFKLDTYRGLLAMAEQPFSTLKTMGESLGDTMYAYVNDLDKVQAKAVRCAFWAEAAGAIIGGKGTSAAIKSATRAARLALSAETAVNVQRVVKVVEETETAATKVPFKSVMEETMAGHYRLEFLDPVSGKRIAKLACMIDADRKLTIMGMKVESAFQGQGVSTSLYREILAAHPDVTEIEFNLAEDNDVVYKQAIAAGKSHLEALQETPAYKGIKKLGFGGIDEAQSTVDKNGMADLVVKRD